MPAKKRKLDFSGVKDRSPFRTTHLPEGDYLGKVMDVADEESSNDNPMWVYTLKLNNGKGVYPYRCVLNAASLWKVRNLFLAAGLKIPKKALALDPNRVVGEEIGITLEDDEYEGKLRSQVADVFPPDEMVGPEPELDDLDSDDTADDVAAEDDEFEEIDDDELEELELEEI